MGRLIRQPCEVCGEKKVEAHHDDYDKPLDVRWLCPAHHAETHREVA
jgi:ribosomal protein S27AE